MRELNKGKKLLWMWENLLKPHIRKHQRRYIVEKSYMAEETLWPPKTNYFSLEHNLHFLTLPFVAIMWVLPGEYRNIWWILAAGLETYRKWLQSCQISYILWDWSAAAPQVCLEIQVGESHWLKTGDEENRDLSSLPQDAVLVTWVGNKQMFFYHFMCCLFSLQSQCPSVTIHFIWDLS